MIREEQLGEHLTGIAKYTGAPSESNHAPKLPDLDQAYPQAGCDDRTVMDQGPVVEVKFTQVPQNLSNEHPMSRQERRQAGRGLRHSHYGTRCDRRSGVDDDALTLGTDG